MVAAWEIKNQKQVLVAILHTEIVTFAWSLGLRRLLVPGEIREFPINVDNYVDPVQGVTARPYDDLRNEACMACLKGGWEYLFFLDSDVVCPPDTIHRLLAHKKPLISGLYFRRSPPVGLPVMMKPVGQWHVNYPRDKVIEVDTVGAGCLLIHRSLLEKCPPQRPGHHWFDWRVNLNGQHPFPLSEDFTFNVWVKQKLNVPTLVDTSVRCRHLGYSESTEGQFMPLGMGGIF